MSVCLSFLPSRLRLALERIDPSYSDISLRSGLPLSVLYGKKTSFVGAHGLVKDPHQALTVYPSEIEETFLNACQHSVYAREEEVREGFLTVEGGHRIGLAGTCVYRDGAVWGMRDISSLNIRMAKEIKSDLDGCFSSVFRDGQVVNTLVVSPPGYGKTTFLRNAARLLSEKGFRVAVIDTRREIAACNGGRPLFDLGPCCDILTGYPREEGIFMAIRSLRPDIIVFDEIGSEETCLFEGLRCGVSFLFSAHGKGFDDVKRRDNIGRLIAAGLIETVIEIDALHQIKVLTLTQKTEEEDENCPAVSFAHFSDVGRSFCFTKLEETASGVEVSS